MTKEDLFWLIVSIISLFIAIEICYIISDMYVWFLNKLVILGWY